MAYVRPGTIVAVGPLGTGFGRSISKELDRGRDLDRFIRLIAVDFDPGEDGLRCNATGDVWTVTLASRDPADIERTFREQREQILEVFVRRYVEVFGDFDRMQLHLSLRHIQVQRLLEFLVVAPAFDPAAAAAAFEIGKLLTASVGESGADPFRVSAILLLPPAGAPGLEQAAAYGCLCRIDNGLTAARRDLSQPRAPFDSVCLANLPSGVAWPSGRPEDQAASLAENPITAVAARLFTDLDIFHTCHALGITLLGTEALGRGAYYCAAGAHHFEYDGPQLAGILRDFLVHDMLEEILLALPACDAGVEAIFDSWRRDLQGRLDDVGQDVMLEWPHVLPSEAETTVTALAAEDVEESAWDAAAQTLYFRRVSSDPRTRAAVAAAVAGLLDRLKHAVDQEPFSCGWAALLADFCLAREHPYLQAAGVDVQSAVAQPVSARLAVQLLPELKRFVEMLPPSPILRIDEQAWASPEDALQALEAVESGTEEPADTPESALRSAFRLARAALVAAASWPRPAVQDLDAQVTQYVDRLQQAAVRLNTEAAALQERLIAIDVEEKDLYAGFGFWGRLWRSREFRRRKHSIGERRQRAQRALQNLQEARRSLVREYFVPGLDLAFRFRLFIKATAKVAEELCGIRKTFQEAVGILLAEAEMHLRRAQTTAFLATPLRTSIIDLDVAVRIYAQEKPLFPAVLDAWRRFPGDVPEYRSRTYAGIEYLSRLCIEEPLQCVAKLSDFAAEYFRAFRTKTVTEMLLRDGAEAARASLEGLARAAMPLLQMDDNIALGTHDLARLAFAGIPHTEGDELPSIIRNVDPLVELFESGHPHRVEWYTFVFGVPAFLLAQLPAYRRHYQNACAAGEPPLSAPNEENLLPEFMLEKPHNAP